MSEKMPKVENTGKKYLMEEFGIEEYTDAVLLARDPIQYVVNFRLNQQKEGVTDELEQIDELWMQMEIDLKSVSIKGITNSDNRINTR